MTAPRGEAPAGRLRRPRSVRASLAMIVLAAESIIVILSALVLFGLKDLTPPLALGGGAGVLVLLLAALALAHTRIGLALGWLVQAVLLAATHYSWAVGGVGVVFTLLWIYCFVAGGRIDARERTAH